MEAMISFVDAYRDKHGVEPICRVIEIAPSTYHAHVARRAKPETAPPRIKRDVMLSVEIKRVFDANFQVYGVRLVVSVSLLILLALVANAKAFSPGEIREGTFIG